MKGTVFSIEEFSVYDGPGIRTTVFLKGCDLRCIWCHNPEGWERGIQIVKNPNGCIGCGKCFEDATIKNGRHVYTENAIKSCPVNLLRYSGVEYTPQELCDKLLKNAEFLKSGGVTFSGGEPLIQFEFVLDCIDILKGKIHTAIQTTGYCSDIVFERVLEKADFFLYDLKLADRDEHKKYTGVTNDVILRHFEMLVKSGKDFVARVPLIPTITDTVANITGICEILKKNNVSYVELLPYNKMAGAKYKLLEMEYKVPFDEKTPSNPREEIFREYNIKTKLM